MGIISAASAQSKRRQGIKDKARRTQNVGGKTAKGNGKSGKNFVQFIWPSKITCRCGRETTTDVCAKEIKREMKRERESDMLKIDRVGGSVCVREKLDNTKRAQSEPRHGEIFKLALTFFVCATVCCMRHVEWHVACCALPLVRTVAIENWLHYTPHTTGPKR